MNEQPRRAGGPSQIVVLGMHRSGTSATAGLLHACGAHVGGPGEMKVPSRVNPRGFFERWDVRGICDGVLDAADASWWKVSRFDFQAIPKADRQALAARAGTVIAGLDRHPVWVMKDPRLCLTLPAFREHLGERAAAVLVVRHPVEIAQSLRRRDGFPVEAGLALWEAYVVAAVRNAAGLPLVRVRFAELVAAPAAAGRGLIEDLVRAGVAGLSARDFAEVIDPALRHHHNEATDSAAMTEAQRDLWALLSDGDTAQLSGQALSQTARGVLEQFEAAQQRKAEVQA
jgi:hypothetical protein